MLRAHKIIHKKGNTRAYQVAPEARTILVAILTAARTSLHPINELQKAAPYAFRDYRRGVRRY